MNFAMNFAMNFFFLIIRVECVMVITRYECDFTITAPLPLSGRPMHTSGTSGCDQADGKVYLSISKGKTNGDFCERYGDQQNVTVRLHIEKKRQFKGLPSSTQNPPNCNGEKGNVIRALGDYGQITITAKTISTLSGYIPRNHPDNCKHNEVGYPNSETCYKNGNLCLALSTGDKKCRCKKEYVGKYCEFLKP